MNILAHLSPPAIALAALFAGSAAHGSNSPFEKAQQLCPAGYTPQVACFTSQPAQFGLVGICQKGRERQLLINKWASPTTATLFPISVFNSGGTGDKYFSYHGSAERLVLWTDVATTRPLPHPHNASLTVSGFGSIADGNHHLLCFER